MKKSELKTLIYETVQEAIGDALSGIELNERVEVARNPAEDRMSLANKLQRTNDTSPYGMPKLKTEVVNGETYTSGQGILEWFNKDKDCEIKTQSKVSGQQIDGLINRVFKK